MAESEREVWERMTFLPAEPREFHRFLNKFTILDEIRWTPELIDRSIAAASRELVTERVDYCWMDFSINKYMDHLEGWHKRDVVHLIRECFDRHAPGRVGLILSLKYESSRASQRQYAAMLPDVSGDVIGIDLVGDESFFDPEFYAPLFREWNSAGKITRAHVAESQGAENCRLAIERMGVREVAHGIKIHDDPEIVRLALDRNVGFSLALTSNFATGIWPHRQFHPVTPMLEAGLEVMIGTDDPVQCGTTYDREFELLHQYVGVNSRLLEKTAERRTREYGLIP